MASMRILLALALVVVLSTHAAWGQDPASWFRVRWEPQAEGATPTPRIEAYVHNDSPYRVTDVRLQVEGVGPNESSVGQRAVWALGDIEPGGETSLVTEAIPGAVSYRFSVIEFDVVSVERAR